MSRKLSEEYRIQRDYNGSLSKGGFAEEREKSEPIMGAPPKKIFGTLCSI